MRDQRLLCIAHRGAMGHAPENTLLSIQMALDLGAQCIEIDVYQVHGQLLVIHDDTLERTTNGTGTLWQHSLEVLRGFDAGQGEFIPLLSEVCDLIAGRACLNIEIKGSQTAVLLVHFLQQLIAQDSRWQMSQFLVSSFHHQELQDLRLLDNTIPLGVLVYGIFHAGIHHAKHLGAVCINSSLKKLTQTLVDEAHREGLKVFVYTVNDPKDIQAMADLGVDGVFTNYPERVLGHYHQPDLASVWQHL